MQYSNLLLSILLSVILFSSIFAIQPFAFADDDDDDDDGGHDKVTICHKPGTPVEKTKQIPQRAVPRHLGHGDTLGPCVDDDAKRVSLFDLGILQLVAHDLFNVDRGDRVNAETAFDFENGKLDLSTLFDNVVTGEPFDDETISKGGEIRNRENIMLFTVASQFGEIYLDFIDDGFSETAAKKKTIRIYHMMFKVTYEKTFDEKFPHKKWGKATPTENLSFLS